MLLFIKNGLLMGVMLTLAACNALQTAKTAQKPTQTWHCFGTEPFWTLDISAADNTVTFEQIDVVNVTLPCQSVSEQANESVYTAEGYKVHIKKEVCYSAGEETYQYSVSINDGAFQGCAAQK
jgi:uncharacterized membrane protein